jgi:cation:H+ antiporter
LSVDSEVLYRDWTVMTALTIAMLLMGFGLTGKSRTISRLDGGLLLLTFLAYTGYLFSTMIPAA